MQRVARVVNHLSFDNSSVCVSVVSSSSEEVLTIEKEHAVKILLNKPKALNALNLNMIEKIQLSLDHAKQSKKKLIVVRGEGKRAFCAGGDIRALATSAKSGNYEYCSEFFSKEFRLDREIAELKDSEELTYVSLLDGITMGGGVGLSVHSKFVVATESIKFAMPETGIGFFCDVGGSYFLPRLPGKLGTYIALTGYRLNLADVLYCGIASHFCPSSQLDELERELLESDGNSTQKILSDFQCSHPVPEMESHLKRNREIIDDCFSAMTMEQILSKLENQANEGNSWAQKTLHTLSNKSPTSLKLELECIRRGKNMNISDVSAMEFNVALQCMRHPDFYEGVRALIIEKDNKPTWNPPALQQIPMSDVFSFFKTI